jgi:hypothetical protein
MKDNIESLHDVNREANSKFSVSIFSKYVLGRYQPWAFLFSAVVSAAVGITTAIFTSTSSVMSAILALLTLLVEMIITMSVSLAQNTAELKLEIANINQITELTLNSAWLRDLLFSMGKNFRQIQQSKDELFERLARSQLSKADDFTYRISVGKGEVAIRNESVQELWGIMFVIAKESEEVLATSTLNPESWWSDHKGREYLNINIMAIKRGVRIRRVLVLKDDTISETEKSILESNLAGGIDIRYCKRSKCYPELRKDFLVVGDRYAGFLNVLEGTIVRESVFTSSHDNIAAAKQDFEQLWVLSSSPNT